MLGGVQAVRIRDYQVIATGGAEERRYRVRIHGGNGYALEYKTDRMHSGAQFQFFGDAAKIQPGVAGRKPLPREI